MTTDQLHLLRAALCPPDEALAHWQAWCRTRHLDPHALSFVCRDDGVEPSHRPLLPLVYWNLKHTDDACVARLKSQYEATLRHNEQVMQRTHSVLEALFNAHLDVVLPGSLPLVAGYYPTLGLRKIDNPTIWVRIQDLNRTLSVLETIGFQSNHQLYKADREPLTFYLNGPQQDRLCLQGHGLTRQPVLGTDVLCSTDRTTLTLPTGLPIRTLSATQLLLQTLINSHQPGSTTFKWIPDSLLLLRLNVPDWPGLLSLVERYVLSGPVRQGLSTLHRHFNVSVPPAVGQRLGQLTRPEKPIRRLPFGVHWLF